MKIPQAKSALLAAIAAVSITMFPSALKAADPVTNVTVVNPNTTNAVKVTQQGTTSNSTSSGGAFNLDNTLNPGAGMVLYTNNGSPTGNLFSARSDNPNFNQATIYGTSMGTGHTLLLVNRSTGTNSAAANIVSTNPNFSAMGVSGQELTHGTIKVTHTGTGNDANAAGLSVDLTGQGTAAQGLYINSTAPGGTSGKLIFVQNGTTPRMILYADGHLAVYGDVESVGGGVVLTDRANANQKYRIYIENGVIKTEAL